jgi:hypothetical protein
MSRSSDYSGADVDAAGALLTERGIDPETVSLPCALAILAAAQIDALPADADPSAVSALGRQAGLHSDCDGTRDAPRRAGTGAAPCLCPVCVVSDHPAHGRSHAAARVAATT